LKTHEQVTHAAETVLTKCLSLPPGAEIVIFADETTIDTASILAEAAIKLELHSILAYFNTAMQIAHKSQKLAPALQTVLNQAAAVLICLNSTPECLPFRDHIRQTAWNPGCKVAHMPGMSPNTLLLVEVDYDTLKTQCELLALALAKSHQIEIISWDQRGYEYRLKTSLKPWIRLPIISDGIIQVYPQKRHKYTSHIPMSDSDCPEVEALDGPDYSIVSIASDPWFLLPLRISSNAQAIGLVSVGKLNFQPSPHQQREEILQLTSLLHQAARAIETKDQVFDLLNTANERADKLKTLNTILTRMLRHQERSEEIILHLTLAGVTSEWGLEFNRAILFMPDENRQRLVGRLGVGHLTRQEAEADWLTFPHPNLQALIDFILKQQIEEKPLHQIIKHFAFALEPAQDDLLVECFKTCESILSSKHILQATLPEDLFKIIGRPSEFALVPLRATDQTLGVLYVDDRFTNRPITPERFELLQTFINQSALALESVHRYLQVKADLERRQERLETMARITSLITSAGTELESGVLRAILHEVKRAIPQAHNVGLIQFDVARQNLVLLPANLEFYRVDQPPVQGSYRIDTEQRPGIAGRVIESGQVVVVPDVQKDLDYITAIDSTRSALGAPIKINGETQAALILESNSLSAFSTDDKRLVEMLADHVAIAIQSIQQFQLARERQLRERIATLATGLIHDINSAVASIPDLANEVEEKLQSGGDITAPLADLRRSALKAGKISSRLRDFVITRQFKPTRIEVETVIQNVLNISLDQKPTYVALEYKAGGLNPEIVADLSWIELLLHNLILNAFDAIPTNQSGVVEIEVDADPVNVLIKVKDNGKGISPENIPRIFEPGFTTKRDSGQLHGFGLYYCHQVVKEHQGDLKVKSTPTIGTIFTVILPKAHSSLGATEE
jgi:signal transduction histidine kinase